MDARPSFAPLAALPLLSQLKIGQPKRGRGEFSDVQIDQLRALPRLRNVRVEMTTPLMRRLLRQPHDLQWQQISLPGLLDDDAAALLPQLPSLTQIIHSWIDCERFDWLRGLPNLTDVTLSFGGPEGAAVGRAAPLAVGLRSCSKIEKLALSNCSDLTTAQLAELLPRLLRLRDLRLSSLDIDSLSFLAQPPLTSRLRRLELSDCRQLPLSELRHAHSLCGLRQLELIRSFSEPMDSLSPLLYTPPSLLLPQLEQFEYATPLPAAEEFEEDGQV